MVPKGANGFCREEWCPSSSAAKVNVTVLIDAYVQQTAIPVHRISVREYEFAMLPQWKRTSICLAWNA